ncbi:unnamed protein product [Caenorhabditis sp. 36 PRJEB53466]|nr:unnamed protein product [Caenorhabditis sp. 36 PRJEB53466]
MPEQLSEDELLRGKSFFKITGQLRALNRPAFTCPQCLIIHPSELAQRCHQIFQHGNLTALRKKLVVQQTKSFTELLDGRDMSVLNHRHLMKEPLNLLESELLSSETLARFNTIHAARQPKNLNKRKRKFEESKKAQVIKKDEDENLEEADINRQQSLHCSLEDYLKEIETEYKKLQMSFERSS